MKPKVLLIKTAVTAGVKISSVIVAFCMTLAITRTLSVEQSGLFLLALAILSPASIFFRLGLDKVVLRLISAQQGMNNSLSSMTTGLQWSLIASLPIALICSAYSEAIAIHLLSKPHFAPVFEIIILALPAIVLFTLIAVGFQAFYRVIVTTFFQNLGISSLFLVGFSFIYFLDPHNLSAVSAAKIYLGSAIIVLFFALFMWNKQIQGKWGKLIFRNPQLWSASSNLWAASSMSLVVQWAGILMASVFVEASDIAYLSVAQRIASLTNFPLMIVNMVAAPRYARLWIEGNISDIHYLAKLSTRCCLGLAVPLVAAMLIWPEYIMGIFGHGYQQGAILLSIMALGQFINVVTGSVGFLLKMTGHEKDFWRITFFVGPLTLILSYFLIRTFGVVGAAIAMAVGLSVQNIGALYMVKKRLGFWPLA